MDAQASDAEVTLSTPENAAQERRRANLAKGRSLATHRPDCGCRICTKRRRVAAQAQGIASGDAQAAPPNSTPAPPLEPGDVRAAASDLEGLMPGDLERRANGISDDVTTRRVASEEPAPAEPLSAQVRERRAIRNAIVLEDDRLLGDVMDDWQREDLEALDRPEVRHAYLERPRGHSKTGDAGSEAVVELLTGKGKVLLAYAADADQARLLFTDVRDKLIRGGYVSELNPRTRTATWQPGDPIEVHVYADRIESTSGNVLRVEASDVSSSWGKRPDWVCLDELVEWRRPELWQAIWSATGKRPRSRVICISTAGWDTSHFSWQVRALAQQEADWYFSSRRQCASWIRPEWLEQQRRTLPEHVFRRLHQNEWVDGFGAFLSSAEVERIFTTEAPPTGGHSAIGLDIGLTRDRTVLAAVRIFPGALLYVDGLEMWQGSRDNKVDLDDVQRSAYEASVRWRAPIWADPHQAVQMCQTLTKRGRQVKEYTFTSASRRDLFAGLLSAIRDGRLRCPPHAELRRELLGLEVQPTASGNYRVDHKVGKFDDHVVALSLAIYGALERDGSFVLPVFGYHFNGHTTQLIGATEPGVTATAPETINPVVRCRHGVDVNGSAPLENQHRAECRDARKKHLSTPINQAPTLVNADRGVHRVVNPSSGKTELYEDRRGLDLTATGPYEQCGRCGAKWPLTQSGERRQAHWIARQDDPSLSESERRRNAACRAWALPNGFTPRGPHMTA